MRDQKRWQEILAAPSALVTADLTLEWAIFESLRKTFGLSREICAFAMQEYRKFRYLCEIAEGPILPPPLIAFIQVRDTPNSSAFAEIKRWSVRASTPLATVSWSFASDPSYQRAVDLYPQEFGAIPVSKIWPTRLQARGRKLAFIAFGSGMTAAMMGDWLQSDITIGLGFVIIFLAMGYLVCFGRHLGEPRGDA